MNGRDNKQSPSRKNNVSTSHIMKRHQRCGLNKRMEELLLFVALEGRTEGIMSGQVYIQNRLHLK